MPSSSPPSSLAKFQTAAQEWIGAAGDQSSFPSLPPIPSIPTYYLKVRSRKTRELDRRSRSGSISFRPCDNCCEKKGFGHHFLSYILVYLCESTVSSVWTLRLLSIFFFLLSLCGFLSVWSSASSAPAWSMPDGWSFQDGKVMGSVRGLFSAHVPRFLCVFSIGDERVCIEDCPSMRRPGL